MFPRSPPAPPATSCLCQPPTHALGALRVWELAQERDQADVARGFLSEIYPKLLAWHRYLATERDPEGSGLVTINHPWESGTDNSPRWDGPSRTSRLVTSRRSSARIWTMWTIPPSAPPTRSTPATSG